MSNAQDCAESKQALDVERANGEAARGKLQTAQDRFSLRQREPEELQKAVVAMGGWKKEGGGKPHE